MLVSDYARVTASTACTVNCSNFAKTAGTVYYQVTVSLRGHRLYANSPVTKRDGWSLNGTGVEILFTILECVYKPFRIAIPTDE